MIANRLKSAPAVLGAVLGTVLIIAGAAVLPARAATSAADIRPVIKTYADMAHAGYEDALITAKALSGAVAALVKSPSAETLAAARAAWIQARIPYQQTEAFRFGNVIVDDWEGKVNAWPLDEGLIDYVSGGYGRESEENDLYTANVIANVSIKINGRQVDAGVITKKLLAETLHEAGGIEANVATGYHAIEFLLWGQDLNGTGPGAGARQASDFDTGNCSNGHCGRRAAYLTTVTELLIDDLAFMTAQWAPGGAARAALMDGAPENALVAMFTGISSLSYGELAGERMKLGLILHDPEEEHDCFSDNTHASHYNDAKGIRNVYLGQYRRVDGRVVEGPGLSGLVAAVSPDTDRRVRAALDATMSKMDAMVALAATGMAYDQMIGEGNAKGNAAVQAVIDALIAQTREFSRATAALKLKSIHVEGSDSLDEPARVN